jgi:hypothetical protein
MSTIAEPSMGIARRLLDLLAAGQIDAVGELYAPDALVDANVPYWHFQLQGPQAIVEILREGYSMPLRVASSRVIEAGEWQIAEGEVHFEEHGEEHLFREVHLIRPEGGRLAEHVIYCTGHWDAETIRRQAAGAPMVRKTDSDAAGRST